MVLDGSARNVRFINEDQIKPAVQGVGQEE